MVLDFKFFSMSQAAEQEKVMLHREDGINHESEQDYVNVMHSFLTGRINDPVAHGKLFLSDDLIL